MPECHQCGELLYIYPCMLELSKINPLTGTEGAKPQTKAVYLVSSGSGTFTYISLSLIPTVLALSPALKVSGRLPAEISAAT